MKSPAFSASSCSTVAGACASSATSSTSAAWICCVIRLTQRRSGAFERRPASSSRGRRGSARSVAYGNAEVDRAAGLADLERERGRDDDLARRARCWRTAAASPSAGSRARAGRCRPRRACSRPSTTSTRRRMMRCSVAEKSRPSMRVGYLPAPPKRASITANTSGGSQTIRPEPRSGRTRDDVEVGRRRDLAQEGAVLVHVHRRRSRPRGSCG